MGRVQKGGGGRATVTAETKGEERVLIDQALDPYPGLYTAGAHAHSRVEVGVTKGFDYGNLRVVSRVVLECDQKSAVLDQAGSLAFEKAKDYAITGFEILLAEAEQETGK